jgi:tetratricopeptide (TPR) repeat protein
MLLPPDTVRATMNEDHFWMSVRECDKAISAAGEEAAALRVHLANTVERLFPEHAGDIQRMILTFDDDVTDDKVLLLLRKLVQAAADQFPQTSILTAMLLGLQRARPRLLGPAVGVMGEVLDEMRADIAVRLGFLRFAIESLHQVNNFEAARIAASEAVRLLDADPQAGGTIVRSQLHNEIGNVRRYERRYPEALEAYRTALELHGDDYERYDTRVILRNCAIVLRDMHRYDDALTIFESLRPFVHGDELLQLLFSEALCLTDGGESAKALALFDAHRLLLLHSSSDSDALPRIATYAQLLRLHQRDAEAQELIAAFDMANGMPSGPLTATAFAPFRSLANAAVGGASSGERDIQRDIDLYERALAVARTSWGLSDTIISLASNLSDALTADGRPDEAESVLRSVWDEAEAVQASKAWMLSLPACRKAFDRNDREQAAKDVLRGVEQLSATLWGVSEYGDPLAILGPNADTVTELVSIVLTGIAPISLDIAAAVRAAADLRAAPLLTPRLRRRVRLPLPFDDLGEESERLSALMKETPCVILQCMTLTDDVGVLVTRPENDLLVTELYKLGIGASDVRRTASRLASALRRVDTNAPDLDFNRVADWQNMQAVLQSLASQLPADLPLCIVPGPLGSTIPTLALGSMRALCFVPSVGALLAMRARRHQLKGGLRFRPRSMFGFAVWFESERAEAVEALSSTIEKTARMAREMGLSHASAQSVEGTGERLLQGLATAELALIACHGRILPDEEAIDLIVSAEGRLPPGDLTSILSDRSAPHVLEWQRLTKLSKASAVVVSTACNSGLAVLHAGGERLGLERPLFGADTVAYIAPQWPVPTVPVQDMAVGLLRRWLSSPDESLVRSVAAQRRASRDAGVTPLAFESFAAFGDCL